MSSGSVPLRSMRRDAPSAATTKRLCKSAWNCSVQRDAPFLAMVVGPRAYPCPLVLGKEGVDRAMEGVVVGKGVGDISVEVAVVAAGATKSL